MSLSSTVKGPSSLSSRQRCCLAMHASHFRCDVGHSACSTISAPDIGHPLLLTAAFTEVSHVHWALPFRHRLRQPQWTILAKAPQASCAIPGLLLLLAGFSG